MQTCFNMLEVIETHEVKAIPSKTRIYDYLPGKLSIITTRKGIKKALQNGLVLINKKRAKSGDYIKSGDQIDLLQKDISPNKIYKTKINVMYEDEHLAIVHKPAGLVVSGNRYKTLHNALPFNLDPSKEHDSLPWPLPIHRLDAPTSGLVIIAKTYSSRVTLGEMIEQRKIHKGYEAIIQGKLSCYGLLNTNVQGKEAMTKFKSVEVIPDLRNDFVTRVKLWPVTGRKHQLRIHLSRLSFPIMGDKTYGMKGNILLKKGLFLAATEVAFKHPKTGVEIEVAIPAPSKFKRFLG